MKQPSLETITWLAIWFAVLSGMVTLAVIVLGKLRGNASRTEDTANELLSNLQDLRQEGDISDAEYRTIKAVLGAKLQQRVKDDQNKG